MFSMRHVFNASCFQCVLVLSTFSCFESPTHGQVTINNATAYGEVAANVLDDTVFPPVTKSGTDNGQDGPRGPGQYAINLLWTSANLLPVAYAELYGQGYAFHSTDGNLFNGANANGVEVDARVAGVSKADTFASNVGKSEITFTGQALKTRQFLLQAPESPFLETGVAIARYEDEAAVALYDGNNWTVYPENGGPSQVVAKLNYVSNRAVTQFNGPYELFTKVECEYVSDNGKGLGECFALMAILP